MTLQAQDRFQKLSDDQARHLMVLDDQWTLGEPGAVNFIGLASLIRMMRSFNGALVEHDGENVGGLAKAGRLLAEFVIELSSQGRTPDEVAEGLSQLSPLVIAALITSYKLTS
jgi:hypothetical protein